ncbi:MAG: formyl transferase [Deltaproteobacteria bacterium]|nr:formyl transferase [Deltaproteobacteria bacterium]MBW1951660.1 formyl transferase [Deltaproteobacteria bacterium]MBW1985760.1 formyl transferase [Deltaproteobacteria bacterium]MBW2134673.1 formyl transferase [Deltaproteobacteria bacterium]
MLSFGWFSSGRDQAAIDLLAATHDHMASGFIPGQIAYVFCDREPGETPAVDRFRAAVEARHLPLVTYSSRNLREKIRRRAPDLEKVRKNYDLGVIERLQGYEARIVVLAGYMLVLSHRLCSTFLCLNLHPGLPGGPIGTWQQVMWELIAHEYQEAGAMMHLATPELDRGPPVTYCHFSLTGPEFAPLWQQFRKKRQLQSLQEIIHQEGEAEPLFARLRAEELRREFPLILLTLKNLAEGRLVLTTQGVQSQGKLKPQGICLTGQVEAYLAGRLNP